MTQEVQIPAQDLNAGDEHYRAYVGPPNRYDLVGAAQFNILTSLGLRQHHKLLDIGCGSLRAGRLFLPYLLPGNYYGIEPEPWLIQKGLEEEIGQSIIDIKKPRFDHNADFNLQVFGETFDYMVAQSIFSHASQQQINTCLQQVRRTLNPGGMFAVNFIQGEENYAGDEWVYPGIVSYTLGFMQSMVRDAGLEAQVLNWFHPNPNFVWLVVYHPANRKNVPHIIHREIMPKDRWWPRFQRSTKKRIKKFLRLS
jgi:SAM-dependent methyltransferase